MCTSVFVHTCAFGKIPVSPNAILRNSHRFMVWRRNEPLAFAVFGAIFKFSDIVSDLADVLPVSLQMLRLVVETLSELVIMIMQSYKDP